MGEDSQTSILREMKEELGYEVQVDQLLWFNENFFVFDNKNFPEIGLYYLVSIKSEFTFSKGPFHGEEGDRLIYQWVPIDELKCIELYPEFLKASLLELPSSTQHIVED